MTNRSVKECLFSLVSYLYKREKFLVREIIGRWNFTR